MRNLLMLAVLAPGLAVAQPGADCASIDSDTDRLACYDAALGRSPTPDPPVAENWNVYSTKSAFTDQTDVYISTIAAAPLSCSYGKTPLLVIQCAEGRTSMVFWHRCFAPANYGESTIEFEYRVDAEPARQNSAQVSTDEKAFGWWDDARAHRRINGLLLGKDLLLVRFQPYKDGAQIMRFNISGLAEVIASTNPSCDWSRLGSPE